MLLAASSFVRKAGSRVIDEGVAHGECCRPQEVRFIGKAAGLSETKVSLVDERRSLQRVIAANTAARALRDVFELIVEGWQQLRGNTPNFGGSRALRERLVRRGFGAGAHWLRF